MQCFHEELRVVLNVLDGNVQSVVHSVDIALYTVWISRASAPCLLGPCCATYMYVAIIVVLEILCSIDYHGMLECQ